MGGRAGPSELEKLVGQTRAKTLEARDSVENRRRARKAAGAEFDFDKLTNSPRERKVNSVDVQRWFEKGIDLLYGGRVTPSPWGGQDRKLAKALLGIYGAGLTKKAVGYFCEHWELICKRSRSISGIPTVKLLWVMRDTVFSDAQLGRVPTVRRKRRKHDAGEYKGGHEPRGTGW